MAIIPNFPQDLLDQHHKWHEPLEHPRLAPLRKNLMGSPGGGTEFLVFHRNFSAQALAWFNTTNFTTDPFDKPSKKASLVAPWTAIPAEMKALSEYASWKADDVRLESGFPNFESEDDLGFFIESRIHNAFLHGAASTAFNEPEVFFLHSPQSTLFYKIHGLVGYWWSKWQRRNVFFPDRPVAGLGRGTTVFFPDQPVPGLSFQLPKPAPDPIEIANLIERVKLLESRLFPLHATVEKPVVEQPDKANSSRVNLYEDAVKI
jgi:hypothetical protein